MSKYLTLFCILGVLALFIVPAYAEVQNVKVGGDIAVRGIFRDDYDLQESNKAASDPNADTGDWFMTTTRLRVDADLTDNVSTTIRVLNERDWDAENETSTDLDLDLASITLKELFFSPLSATLGRQELVLGDGLIIANPYPDVGTDTPDAADDITAKDLSARRAFDAIRAILDYDPWTINLIFAKIDEVQNTLAGTAPRSNDIDLLVANAGYKLSDTTELEGYLGYKRHPGKELRLTSYSGVTIDERRTYEDLEVFFIGGRASLEPAEKLTLKGEIGYQFGELHDTSHDAGDKYSLLGGTDFTSKDIDVSGFAVDVGATYAIDYTWSPKLGVKYAFRSGEKASSTGDYDQWDPLYEGQVNGVVANALSLNGLQNNNTNMNIIGVNGSVVPLEDLTVSIDYYRYTLDENLDTSSNISSVYIADDYYGDEVDLGLKYAYTSDVSLELLYGMFIPGDAFENTYDNPASEIVGTVKVTF